MDQPAIAQRLSAGEINAFYQRVIAPKVADIEARRNKAAFAFGQRAVGALVLNLAVCLFFVSDTFARFVEGTRGQGDSPDGMAVQIMLSLVIISLWFTHIPLAKFKRETKSQLMGDIVTIFPGFVYDIERRFPDSLLKEAGIFPGYDISRGGDFIAGQYRDVTVNSSNVVLISETRDSKGRKQENTVFEGPVYHLGFPRRFNGVTRVRRDGGWLGNTFGGWFAGLERVALEDPVFEKTFQVYSSDQVEARYILTTGFMELLLRVASRHKNNIEAAFFNQHILLKVKGQAARLQVTNPLRRIDWPREVARFVDEFQDAFALVDELKLNQKIGM